jgi:hypothetical protein
MEKVLISKELFISLVRFLESFPVVQFHKELLNSQVIREEPAGQSKENNNNVKPDII